MLTDKEEIGSDGNTGLHSAYMKYFKMCIRDRPYDEDSDEQSGEQSEIYDNNDTDADAEDFENGQSMTSGQQSEPSDGQNGEKGRNGKKKNGLFGFLHRKEK